MFSDEREKKRGAGRQCDIRLLKSPTSFRSETAERQFNIRMGRAEKGGLNTENTGVLF